MKNLSIRYTIVIAVFTILFISCNNSSYEVGSPYPDWNEGEMEIHFINTGHGESQFLILPDGTSMLIDAGDHDPRLYKKLSEARPDSSRRSGEWIARYIKQQNPYKDKVDYMIVSHFHSDHMGLAEENLNLKYNKDSSYILSGITEVGQTIRFAKIIDRGYPNYNKPVPVRYKEVDNYRIFIDEKAKEYGLKQEAFEIGSNQQFHLTKKPKQYKNFTIQNLSANGAVWNGTDIIDYFGSDERNTSGWINENSMSIGLLISYGKFDYLTAGDITGYVFYGDSAKVDLAAKIAEMCPNVEICKMNHHGYKDAMSEKFVRTIQAEHYINSVWDQEHFQPNVLGRIFSDSINGRTGKVYVTNIPKVIKEKYKNEAWMQVVTPETGHIVVRVSEGGDQYTIYILTDEDESRKIKAIYGPFSVKPEK